MLNSADIRVVVQPMNIGRRMPRRSGGQLISLEQNDICPSQFRQMIEDRASNHAPTDNNRLCMRFHSATFVFQRIYIGASSRGSLF